MPTGSVTGTRLVDADPTDVVAFARNTTQVLNIVTGGGAVKSGAVVSPATGIFFPAGLNAGANWLQISLAIHSTKRAAHQGGLSFFISTSSIQS